MTSETVTALTETAGIRRFGIGSSAIARLAGIVFTAAIALSLTPLVSNTLALKLILWISFGLCALSLDFVWGRAGIFSFGQNALFGLGGYAYAVIALNLFPTSQETITALVSAGLVGGLAAAGLGYFLFYSRLSDVYLSIVTLAVTLIIYTILASTAGPEYRIGEALLGGFNGIPSLPGIAFPDWMHLAHGELSIRQLLIFSIVFTATVYACLSAVVHGSFGLKIVGLRSNELRMELLGYDTRSLKIIAFTIGGVVAGLGGGLFAAWGTFVNPSVFSLAQAATVVVWVMVGGRGTLLGAFVGVLLVQSVADAADLVITQQTPLIVGIMLILVVTVMPQGIVPAVGRLLRRRTRGSEASTSVYEIPEGHATTPARSGTVLVQSIAKAFDGVRVLEEITTSFGEHPVHAIIGPNGAGKSTFFNILTGRHRPDRGRVVLNGIDVSKMPPHIRCRRGLGIKMQVPCVFSDLTVAQNLELASLASSTAAPSDMVLKRIGLWNLRKEVANTLSHGQQQWLEMALVLVQNPSVILFDEPGAGMGDDDKRLTILLIQQLSSHHTIVVVEHDMEFVRSLAAPVLMLHQGSVFRSGSFEEIVNDQSVIEAYLGGRKHDRQ